MNGIIMWNINFNFVFIVSILIRMNFFLSLLHFTWDSKLFGVPVRKTNFWRGRQHTPSLYKKKFFFSRCLEQQQKQILNSVYDKQKTRPRSMLSLLNWWNDWNWRPTKEVVAYFFLFFRFHYPREELEIEYSLRYVALNVYISFIIFSYILISRHFCLIKKRHFCFDIIFSKRAKTLCMQHGDLWYVYGCINFG